MVVVNLNMKDLHETVKKHLNEQLVLRDHDSWQLSLLWMPGFAVRIALRDHTSDHMKLPPMLEKWNYIPWESRFRRFLDNKLEEGERMWRLIEKGPYVRPMILDPADTRKHIIEPLSKMTEINKKQYIANVRVMNYLLQAIPNDIYYSVDTCKTTKKM
nr:hypothetical protein [Tanacetum cinerariifolium]